MNGSVRLLKSTDVLNEQSNFTRNNSIWALDLNDPIWASKSGNAPKDLSHIETRFVLLPLEFSLFVVVIALCVSIFQISQSVKRKNKSVFNWHFTLGCLVLNFSTIIILVGNHYLTEYKCWFNKISLSIGLTLVNGVVFAFTLKQKINQNKKRKIFFLAWCQIGRTIAGLGNV